jgi:hypothetical protein
MLFDLSIGAGRAAALKSSTHNPGTIAGLQDGMNLEARRRL